MATTSACYIVVVGDSEIFTNYGFYRNSGVAEDQLKESGWKQHGHSRFWKNDSLSLTACIETVECLPRNELPKA